MEHFLNIFVTKWTKKKKKNLDFFFDFFWLFGAKIWLFGVDRTFSQHFCNKMDQKKKIFFFTRFGPPVLDRPFWTTRFGPPILDRPFWTACFGPPVLDRLFWTACFGPPIYWSNSAQLLSSSRHPEHVVMVDFLLYWHCLYMCRGKATTRYLCAIQNISPLLPDLD